MASRSSDFLWIESRKKLPDMMFVKKSRQQAASKRATGSASGAIRRRWIAGALVGLGTAQLSLVARPARAGDLTWDNAAGTFVWNTTDLNWTGLPWDNAAFNGAVFGATGIGTITVATGINARGLNFGTNNGYTLTGGSLNLSSLGTSPTVSGGQIIVGGATSALTAMTATINSAISSTTGLLKTGDGTLVLGGANTIRGYQALGSSGLGANILIGSATINTFGGSLKVNASSALAGSTVALGSGFFDIGSSAISLAGLTYANTVASSVTPTSQGVIGSGTLTLTGSLRVIGNATGYGNTFNPTLDAGGGTLRLEIGNALNGADEIALLGTIQNGSLLKTYGVNKTGNVSLGGFTLGGNNTYTGSTTINGSTTNVVTGTNASTALNVVNGTATLQGASGSLGSATAVRVVSNANLTLSDTAAVTARASPAVAAGVLANRVNSAAAVTLDGGAITLTGGATADATQTLASLAAPQGFNRVNLVNGTGFNSILTLTGNLTLGTGSTLVVGGANLGTTATMAPTANRFVVNGSVPAAVNGLIPGLYTATSSDGAPSTFARNSATAGVGIVGLAASDYTLNSFAGGATANVDLTLAQTLAASASANAIRTSVDITIGAGNTLTVGAGGLLTTGIITVAGPGTLAFGATPGIITANTTTTFSGPITGSAGLYRSGAGAVTLSGDLSGLGGPLTLAGIGTTNLNTATFAGAINLQGGTFATNSNIGTGGTVTLGSANTPAGAVGAATTLNINNAAVPTFARNIAVVGGDATSPFAGASGMVLTGLTSASQTVSGNIALGTHLSVNGATTAGTATTLSGVISGVGGLNVLTGTNVLTNASNTFSGGMLINGGTTTAAATSDTAFGTGAVRLLNGGTLRTDYAGTFNRGLTVLTTGTVNTNGNNVSVAGAVSGENPSSVLTKTGAGTLTIAAAGAFPGSFTVNGGTLLINGSTGAGSAVTVNTGATLGGSGTIGGAVTVASGGTLAPGNSPGILSTGNVSLASGSTFLVDLAGNAPGTGYDQLNVTGTVSLGSSNLLINAGFAPSAGDKFFLISNDSTEAITGTFSGLAEGGAVSFSYSGTTYAGNITYGGNSTLNSLTGGNDVALYGFAAVPEPGTLVLLVLGVLPGAALLGRRRGV